MDWTKFLIAVGIGFVVAVVAAFHIVPIVKSRRKVARTPRPTVRVQMSEVVNPDSAAAALEVIKGDTEIVELVTPSRGTLTLELVVTGELAHKAVKVKVPRGATFSSEIRTLFGQFTDGEASMVHSSSSVLYTKVLDFHAVIMLTKLSGHTIRLRMVTGALAQCLAHFGFDPQL